MSTIRAILDADADGSVHIPLPEELRRGKVMVIASLSKAPGPVPTNHPVSHLRKIANRGGLKSITNPMLWQKEAREDRSMPGRD